MTATTRVAPTEGTPVPSPRQTRSPRGAAAHLRGLTAAAPNHSGAGVTSGPTGPVGHHRWRRQCTLPIAARQGARSRYAQPLSEERVPAMIVLSSVEYEMRTQEHCARCGESVPVYLHVSGDERVARCAANPSHILQRERVDAGPIAHSRLSNLLQRYKTWNGDDPAPRY